MNQRKHYSDWQRARAQIEVPDQFASRVMLSIQRELTRYSPKRSRSATLLSALALAAGVLFVILCQVGTVGIGIVALTGVAQ